MIMDKMTNIQELDSVSEICPKCGTRQVMEVELFGRKRKVPVMCKCKQEEYEKQKEEEEKKQRQLRLEKLRKYSLMDQRFEQCTFENFQIDENNEKLYKLATSYCNKWQEMKKKNVGFLFWGPPGTGKTYLSFCIANRLLENLIPVIAISSIGILNRIKETYNSYGKEGEVEVINSLKNASLLIIDDLGAENGTDWAKEKLYEIIDSRYRDAKPMIVTTNLTKEQLKEKLTTSDGVTRTYDRLIEMCYPIEIKGASRRVKTASDKVEIIKELLK